MRFLGPRCLVSWIMPALLVFLLVSAIGAQGLPESLSRGNPSNDCGCARGDDAIPVSSGMLSPFLPKIPNLELGFLYYFGNNVRTGRFTADYVLPFRLSSDSVLFGEAHAEGWNFWQRPSLSGAPVPGVTTTTSWESNRVDLSFGGGYRTMLGANTLLGVNGFYDTSRLFNKWYPSGGVGLEFAANVAGDDAIDLNFNWHGSLFNRDILVNAFRNKGNSFDVEAGYSHALFDQALDLRLKLIGYQFDIGTPVRGWRTGADLTTRDGVFTTRYEYGHDPVDGYYSTVGGFVNVGFQLENLLRAKSPFTLPEPVFRSPRDLSRLLGLKVKRNWHQPEAVVLARSTSSCPNLQEHVYHLNDYEQPALLPLTAFDSPITPIPPLSQVTVRFCWCGLQNPQQAYLGEIVLTSGGRQYQGGSAALLNSTSGCASADLRFVSPHPGEDLYFGYASPPPRPVLHFIDGGGISLQLNP